MTSPEERLARAAEHALWTDLDYELAQRHARRLLDEVDRSRRELPNEHAQLLRLSGHRTLAVVLRDRSDPVAEQHFANALSAAANLHDQSATIRLIHERITARINRGFVRGAHEDMERLTRLTRQRSRMPEPAEYWRKLAGVVEQQGHLERANSIRATKVLTLDEDPLWRATTLVQMGRTAVVQSEAAAVQRDRLVYLRRGFQNLERAKNVLDGAGGHRLWSMTLSTAWTLALMSSGDFDAAWREHREARLALTRLGIRNYRFEANEVRLVADPREPASTLALTWSITHRRRRAPDSEAAFLALFAGMEALLESAARWEGMKFGVPSRSAFRGFLSRYDAARASLGRLSPPVDLEIALPRAEAQRFAATRNRLAHTPSQLPNALGSLARLESALVRLEAALPEAVIGGTLSVIPERR